MFIEVEVFVMTRMELLITP